MDMRNLAVIRRVEGEDNFTFSFNLSYKGTFNVERQFNLNRKLEEPSNQFLDRLNSSLEKVILKKLTKKRKKNVDDELESRDDLDYKAKFQSSEGNPVEFSDKIQIQDVLFKSGLQLEILGQNFKIKENPAMVSTLKLPEVMMAGFLVYPDKLVMEFADPNLCRWEWLVSEKCFKDDEQQRDKIDTSNLNFKSVFRGNFFKPSNEDIGRFVKLICTPVNAKKELGLVSEAVSKNVISPGPGLCPFENRHKFTENITTEKEVRVVTYNLLADIYADSDYSREILHPQCPAYALDIKYRKQLMLKELTGYNADILTLQEVDGKIHDRDIIPVLESKGFKGIFHKKGGQTSEGLSCFWRADKFELEFEERIVLGEVLAEREHFKHFFDSVKEKAELLEQIVNRTTTLQVLVLRSKFDPKRKILIGNTHLYFFPEADNIRIFQAGMCIKELELKRKSILQPDQECALLFCGDFNSSPGNAVLRFVRSGFISDQDEDWNSWKGKEIRNLELKHDLEMDSACGVPKFTNYTIMFKDCLDYIFYDKSSFEIKEIVPFPTEDELEFHRAIPNIVFPSDHLACVSLLKWKG